MNASSQRFPLARIDPTAHVADSAVLVGPVTIGPESVVGHGAVLVAEGGRIEIGRNTIVMENSVLRSTQFDDCVVGNNVMIGPHCHLTGCRIGDEVFVATGVSVFNGANVEAGSELRINAVVHLLTRVPAGETVPIGWIAVGNPAQMFPPDQHDAIWEVQKTLNFPMKVFGVDRDAQGGDGVVKRITDKYSKFLLRQARGG